MATGAPTAWSQSDYGPLLGVVSVPTASDNTTFAAGRSIAIICTVAGNVALTFQDGTALTIPVGLGMTVLPWAVQQVLSTGTTATATYANLR